MVMLFAGIALEFRFHAKAFRRGWDYAFAGGSVLAALRQGFAISHAKAGRLPRPKPMAATPEATPAAKRTSVARLQVQREQSRY